MGGSVFGADMVPCIKSQVVQQQRQQQHNPLIEREIFKGLRNIKMELIDQSNSSNVLFILVLKKEICYTNVK